MSIINELDQKIWSEWVSSKPESIQKLCKKLPPDRLYKMISTGNRVTIHSYSEDNTVTVDITGKYNLLTFERKVFGIDPDDLEECDLPGKDERLGMLFDPKGEAVDVFIDMIKPNIH